MDRLFSRRELPAAKEGQEQMERILVEGFRTLSQFCAQMADRVESIRLQRGGYRTPGEFLERLERRPGAPPAAPRPTHPPLRPDDRDPS